MNISNFSKSLLASFAASLVLWYVLGLAPLYFPAIFIVMFLGVWFLSTWVLTIRETYAVINSEPPMSEKEKELKERIERQREEKSGPIA